MNYSNPNSTGIIIGATLVVVGSGEARNLVTGKGLKFQPVLGGFILGAFLFILALVNDNLVQKICYLLIAFALIANGPVIATTLMSTTKPKPTVVGGGGGGGRPARTRS